MYVGFLRSVCSALPDAARARVCQMGPKAAAADVAWARPIKRDATAPRSFPYTNSCSDCDETAPSGDANGADCRAKFSVRFAIATPVSILAIFLNGEFVVHRFDALGVARNRDGFVHFRLAVGRPRHPDNAILVRIDADVFRAAGVFRRQLRLDLGRNDRVLDVVRRIGTVGVRIGRMGSNGASTEPITKQVVASLNLMFDSSHCRRRDCAGLQAPHQEEDEYDYHDDTDNPARSVTPAARVRPGGQDADEHQDQNNQQNGAKAHALLLIHRHRFAGAKTPTRPSRKQNVSLAADWWRGYWQPRTQSVRWRTHQGLWFSGPVTERSSRTCVGLHPTNAGCAAGQTAEGESSRLSSSLDAHCTVRRLCSAKVARRRDRAGTTTCQSASPR